MGVLVVAGAKCVCSFGAAPSTLAVTSQMGCQAGGKATATITDCQPNINLPPFGMCASLANPAVASATAAALGVLTPQPCTFVPAGTWIATNSKLLVGGKPCLTNDASLVCGLGAGSVRIIEPGQTKVLIETN